MICEKCYVLVIFEQFTLFWLVNSPTKWNNHCVKSVQIQVFSGPYFPLFGPNVEIYSVNLRIQSEYRKILTRKNSVFGYFSPSECINNCKETDHICVIKKQIQITCVYKIIKNVFIKTIKLFYLILAILEVFCSCFC